MKQYVILGSAIILIIILNIVQTNYLKNTSEELFNIMHKTKKYISEENFDQAYIEALKFEENWENKSQLWDVLTEHDDVEELESSLASLKAFVISQDYSESLNETAKIEQRIQHILENETLSFATIF